ncbi:hypothetical protein [Mycobacterium sp. HNNTM2301]
MAADHILVGVRLLDRAWVVLIIRVFQAPAVHRRPESTYPAVVDR